MKQQIIVLKKKLLLVELPEDYVVVSVFPPKRTLTMWNENGQYLTEKLDFNVEEIGKLTDITESQFSQWVDRDSCWGGFVPTKISYKESFFSKLEKDGIYFTNPLGEFPTKHNTGLEYGMEYQASWEEAQEKVWDKDSCIFEII